MQNLIFGIIGGLGLFLFGMKSLSDGLQQVAGSKLKRLMRSLTDSKLKGLFLGTIVTSIIQSSSITTVLLVGLLNAGIINLFQSAAVIYGANIGTTITAQIIAFKVTKYALPAIGLGFAIYMIARKRKNKEWGKILLSLGLIFLGLSTMSSVLKPLKDNPAMVEFLVNLGKSPFLGIAVGTIITILVQSSSAAIGMVLAVASVGLIDFNAALYLLLGTNIGTTVTAWLASINSHLSAKRMALLHSIFNILGSTYFAVLIYMGLYGKFVDYITPGILAPETLGRHIANAHTIFNIINAIIFLPLTGLLVKLTEKILPGDAVHEAEAGELKFLQDHLIASPEIAIESAYKEIDYMAQVSQKSFVTAMDGFFDNNPKTIHKVAVLEDAVDNLQSEITFYLSKISTHTLSNELSAKLPKLLHMVNDIERISDHAENLSHIADRKMSEKIPLSQPALEEIKTMYNEIKEMFDSALEAIEEIGTENNSAIKNINT